MQASVSVNCDIQHNTMKDLDSMSAKGQPAKAPPMRSSITTLSTWKAHSPLGSLMSIIRLHSHLPLYVDPLFWTPYHLELLKVSISLPSSDTTSTQLHRPTCPKCNSCGKVPLKVLNLVQTYPYQAEKDRNLMRLVQSTIDSLRTSSQAPFFKNSRKQYLPLSFGGKKRCWVIQPVVVQDITSGTPLVAFSHESSRCDQFNDRFPRCLKMIKAEARSVATTTRIWNIHPHDVAILIAMAQEAQRIQSGSKLQDQRAVLFTVSLNSLYNISLLTFQQPTLISPTPDRDALYIYRASLSSDYLESFIDIHKPLESEMHIVRTTIPFDNTTGLLECLGEVLDIHQRLKTTTKSIVAIEKENQTQKSMVSTEENHHPSKRKRHTKVPLGDIAAPNTISGG